MAGNLPYKGKRYACLTPEQQQTYNNLNEKQKKYIDFRGQGYSKAQSYKMAGYTGANLAQASWLLEERHREIKDLCKLIIDNKLVRELTEKESEISKRVDTVAKQNVNEAVLSKINGMDEETARRIQFYRNIINGEVKSYKRTVRRNGQGAVIETRVEETCDIDTKMKARKELDKLLGLNTMPDFDSLLKAGEITINIVDASKKDEQPRDEEDKIVLKEGDVGGHPTIIIEEEKEEKPKGESASE